MTWTVTGTFEKEEDAQALVELARDLGVELRAREQMLSPLLPIHQTRVGKVILAALRRDDSRCLTKEDIKIALEEAEYSPKCYSVVIKLVREGFVDRIEPGLYQIRRAT